MGKCTRETTSTLIALEYKMQNIETANNPCVERGEVAEIRVASAILIQINKTPVSGLGGVGVSFSDSLATSPSNTAQFDTEWTLCSCTTCLCGLLCSLLSG